MNPATLATLGIFAAYLIGAIPFAYLVAFAVRGVDIRTVGSGNVGATNVGRLLGMRYFFLVFALDLLKGFLPTYGVPRLVAHLAGAEVDGLEVMVALAAILGHNFPVYLRFKGGKGVATSLGAMAALDATASLATAGSFVLFVFLTRYISLSSALGALRLRRRPLRQDAAGLRPQECRDVRPDRRPPGDAPGPPPEEFREDRRRDRAQGRPRPAKSKVPPSGRTLPIVVVGVAVLALVMALVGWMTRTPRLDCGAFTLAPVARASTGHQRADRVAFADGGGCSPSAARATTASSCIA